MALTPVGLALGVGGWAHRPEGLKAREPGSSGSITIGARRPYLLAGRPRLEPRRAYPGAQVPGSLYPRGYAFIGTQRKYRSASWRTTSAPPLKNAECFG